MAESDDPFDGPQLSDSLRALARRGVVRRYRKSTVLVQEGEPGDTIYVILSGRLRAFASGDKGREITYGVYGPGEYIGEMSLDGGPRSATVVTLEAATCALVTRATLLEHFRTAPEFALELMSRVILRARVATAQARGLALLDAYGRLVQLLDSLAERQPDGSRLVRERLTHAEVASRIGCSREMVSRLLKDLERGGYVRHGDGGRWLLGGLPARW